MEEELRREKVESDQAVRIPPEAPVEGVKQKQFRRWGRKAVSFDGGITESLVSCSITISR